MLRGKRLIVLSVALGVALAAALYGLTRERHSIPAGPYATVVERLHEINHQMRDIHHSYKGQHDGEEAFQRWHDLLHEERDLLHQLPGALEAETARGAGEHKEP
jgi:hypothetical protein